MRYGRGFCLSCMKILLAKLWIVISHTRCHLLTFDLPLNPNWPWITGFSIFFMWVWKIHVWSGALVTYPQCSRAAEALHLSCAVCTSLGIRYCFIPEQHQEVDDLATITQQVPALRFEPRHLAVKALHYYYHQEDNHSPKNIIPHVLWGRQCDGVRPPWLKYIQAFKLLTV